MHNYQLYLLMSEQHVGLNPVITLQHVSPLTCQVFQCSIKRCNQWRAVFIACKNHRAQVDADTCKYQYYKTLKHWPLICKTQTIIRIKCIKLQVSFLLCKANVFEQNCDAYTHSIKLSNDLTATQVFFLFLNQKMHQIIGERWPQNVVNWSF